MLGVGGYASGPLVFAAALLGYPTAIQEQNSLPGFTNRMLGRVVRRVFVAFDDAAARFARRKVRFLGNPVRRSFLDRAAAAGSPRQPARATDGAIVILGGSQGSRAVNELASGHGARARRARAAAADRPPDRRRPSSSEMQVNYAALGYEGRVDVRAFIDDMPAVLARGRASWSRARAR